MLKALFTANVLAIAEFLICLLRLVLVPVQILELLQEQSVTALDQLLIRLPLVDHGCPVVPLGVELRSKC